MVNGHNFNSMEIERDLELIILIRFIEFDNSRSGLFIYIDG